MLQMNIKNKDFPSKVIKLRGRMECWVSILTLVFNTTKTVKLSAVHVGRTLFPRNFLISIRG